MSTKEEAIFRYAQGQEMIDFIDRIDAYEFFNELRSNPEKIKGISFERFNDFVERINGIARNIPISQRRADGEDVGLEGFIESVSVPRQNDKEPLLREAFEAIPKLARKEDLQYMIPLVINAVHLFEDGNGRTSRVMHTLLKEFPSKEEFNKELAVALGEYGRHDSFDISPGFIGTDVDKIVLMNHGISFGTENYGWDPIAPVEVPNFWTTLERPQSLKAKEFMKLTKNDFQLCFVVAYNYLKQQNILDQALSKKTLEDGELKFLSPAMMDEILKPEDWENLINEYWDLKKEEVEVMIGMFAEPDKYKNLEGSMTLRDMLIDKINKKHDE